MMRPAFLLRAFAFLSLSAMALPETALAQLTRWIQTSGTASAPGGNATITIESFSKPDFPGGAASLSPATPIVVTVPVPAGYTSSQTTQDIRDSLDANLGLDYVLSTPASNVVQIDRTVGTFTMSISDMVPGQTIVQCFSTCTCYGVGCPPGGGAPALSLPETGVLAILALGLGLLSLGRLRRRPG